MGGGAGGQLPACGDEDLDGRLPLVVGGGLEVLGEWDLTLEGVLRPELGCGGRSLAGCLEGFLDLDAFVGAASASAPPPWLFFFFFFFFVGVEVSSPSSPGCSPRGRVGRDWEDHSPERRPPGERSRRERVAWREW